ncbi:MAG: SpoIVB peptidase [Clostridiales bacterium]|nr:SpoIVB peptidase [Clostridiales bacterium]
MEKEEHAAATRRLVTTRGRKQPSKKTRYKRILAGIPVAAFLLLRAFSLCSGGLPPGGGLRYDPPPLFRTDDGGAARLFGRFSFGRGGQAQAVEADSARNLRLIPGGNTIGIRIHIGGVMVVGFSDIRGADGKKRFPARDAGLRTGDVVTKVNGAEVTKTDGLLAAMEAGGGAPLRLELKRDGAAIAVTVTPALSGGDGAYKIGAWVRDSSSGIGTVTFTDPESGAFGALGHGITDADTGKLIPAENGDVLRANIVGVKKGERGAPGELRGVFSDARKIGNVEKNTDAGIFGTVRELPSGAAGQPIPTGTREQAHTGEAFILSNIESDTVERYAVEIQRVMKNAVNNKGMILKITDGRLLAKTGGIVQGMSGSPILQDGRLIGAVTHVLINDPARGYGTFIDLMLRQSDASG